MRNSGERKLQSTKIVITEDNGVVEVTGLNLKEAIPEEEKVVIQTPIAYEGGTGDMEVGSWIMIQSDIHGSMRGYVEKMPDSKFCHKVSVRCFEAEDNTLFDDNENYAKHGFLVHVLPESCKLLPDTPVKMEEGYVRNMIDYALTIKDKEMFDEYTATLMYLQSQNV